LVVDEKTANNNRKKLKSILQSAGGMVVEEGKNLLVDFKTTVEILDDGNCLKINGTNKINVGEYGFRIDNVLPTEGMGSIRIKPKVYSIPLPVVC